MVRIVVVHNRYASQAPSGENVVVAQEIELLREAGHEVHTYLRDSDEIAAFGPLERAGLAIRPIRSRADVHAFATLLTDVRPDVVHLHNPYPLISPWVVRVAAGLDVPVVQTVHNYRMSCVAGSFYRDGHACEDCLGRALPWPAVAHGCYRGSRVQSVPMALALAAHRGTWALVDRFLPLTTFVAEKLQAAGVPETRITVRPNAVPDPGPPEPGGRGFLFAARFDREKGVLLLLDAWERSGLGPSVPLVIAGDGELADEVRRRAARLEGVQLTGPVTRSEVGRLMARAAVVVVPSLGYEAFPLTVVEAFSRGRPVLATRVGGLPRLVDDEVGWIADADPSSLAARLVEAAAADVAVHSAAARRRYERQYTPQVVLDQLVGVYGEVRRTPRGGSTGPRKPPGPS